MPGTEMPVQQPGQPDADYFQDLLAHDEQPEPVEPCDHVGAGADLTSEGMVCRRCGALIESMPL